MGWTFGSRFAYNDVGAPWRLKAGPHMQSTKRRDRYGNQQENQENYSETNGQETGSDETVGGAGRMESRQELRLNQEERIGGLAPNGTSPIVRLL
jgi:hypothetical protein